MDKWHTEEQFFRKKVKTNSSPSNCLAACTIASWCCVLTLSQRYLLLITWQQQRTNLEHRIEKRLRTQIQYWIPNKQLKYDHLSHTLLLWALTLCPVQCTLVYCTGWSLLHVSYSDVFSTKLHLKFSEPACFDTINGATFI